MAPDPVSVCFKIQKLSQHSENFNLEGEKKPWVVGGWGEGVKGFKSLIIDKNTIKNIQTMLS